MPIYLDYNATAPVRPEAIEKMQEILTSPANASSVHGFGRIAKKHLEQARKIIADAVGAFTDEITFVSGGTEANVTVLCGIPGRRMLVSSIEHSSMLKGCSDATHIPVDASGVVDLSTLEKLLAADAKPALVAVMLANNETGVIQPVAEIAALCRKHNALFHCDAVQGFGKIPVDFGTVGCDTMSLSAHKCGGPVGAAALIARRGLPVAPLLKGGGQEMGRRSGTENVAAIAGFAKAVELFDFDAMKKLRRWLSGMEAEMEALGGTIFGKLVERTPNTTSVAMPGVASETQLIDFDLKGFAVSAGSACSSGSGQGSHVIAAMGPPPGIAMCAIRVSGGWNTKEEEIAQFTAAWKQTCGRLAKKQDVA